MWAELVAYLFQNHLGKVVGGFAGFIFGYLAIKYGLFQAVFVLLCIGLGLYLGKRYDEGGNLKALVSKVWGE